MGCRSILALVFNQLDVIKTRLRRHAIFFTKKVNFLLKPTQDGNLLRQRVFFKSLPVESTFETFSQLFFANYFTLGILYRRCFLVEKCGKCVFNLVQLIFVLRHKSNFVILQLLLGQICRYRLPFALYFVRLGCSRFNLSHAWLVIAELILQHTSPFVKRTFKLCCRCCDIYFINYSLFYLDSLKGRHIEVRVPLKFEQVVAKLLFNFFIVVKNFEVS
jgi:hypothetical protein